MLVRTAVHRPVAVSMACLAIALLGVQAWRNIPIELLPETSLPRVIVTASWPGASPETTEAFLTSPIEGAVQQVRGVETIVSESGEQNGAGTARITVEFARATDMEFARLELSEALRALDRELPAAALRPRVQQYVPREFEDQSRPFLSYTLTGPYTLEALRTHVDDEVAPALLQLDGVADVWAEGGRRRLLEIALDETRVRALGFDAEVVRSRVRELESVREAGVVEEDGRLRTLALRERPGSADEIRGAVVMAAAGRPIRVRDVARVHDTYAEPAGYYRIDGRPAVAFSVVREAGTSAVEVADAVRARVDSLALAAPTGARFILGSDESAEIRRQLGDLRTRALIAAAAVLLVLILFLRSAMPALVVFATIGFSVLLTFNLLYFRGYSLNVLTLMGLAMGFGLMVDNAIVVLENVYRRIREGEARLHAAEAGAREVVLPVLAATLTNLLVLVPFIYLQGELRVYYLPLAVVVALGQLASLAVAFTFVPALAARVVRPGAGDARAAVAGNDATAAAVRTAHPAAAARGGAAAVMAGSRRRLGKDALLHGYAAAIRCTLRHPWKTVLTALLILAGSFLLFHRYVNRGVLWSGLGGQGTYLAIQISQPRGEELDRTDELARHFESLLEGRGGVERVTTQVRAQLASIRIDFADELESSGVPEVLKEELSVEAQQFGGAEVRVTGYGPSFGGGSAVAPNYTIQVLGYNYETVRDIAEGLSARLQRFSRVRDVDTNSSGQWFSRDRASEIALKLDRRRLALYGIDAQTVVRHVRAAVQGQDARERTRVGPDELDFSVKLSGHRTLELRRLLDLQIPGDGGAAVRLSDVATAEERQVMTRILREDQQYRRFVSYEFRGPSKLGDRVQQAVIDATHLPPGYSVIGREAWRWHADERRQIYAVVAVALLMVFMVTAALFESLRQPLCVLLSVPMALSGVFLVFFWTGASFTREAYVGVIMMGGIVVNNAILLVHHVNQCRAAGLPLEEAVVAGTIGRARPILMTTCTTVFGLLPLVLFAESADASIWNALAYALIGGLTSSTLLVLTVTPALYLLFERRRARVAVADRAGSPVAALQPVLVER